MRVIILGFSFVSSPKSDIDAAYLSWHRQNQSIGDSPAWRWIMDPTGPVYGDGGFRRVRKGKMGAYQ